MTTELRIMSQTSTLTQREIETIIKLLLPGEFTKLALEVANKAVNKYNKSLDQKDKSKPRTMANRAGLRLSPSRVENIFRQRLGSCSRVGKTASVYFTAVIKYLLAKLSGNKTTILEFELFPETGYTQRRRAEYVVKTYGLSSIRHWNRATHSSSTQI